MARGLTPAGPEHSWQLLRGKDGTHAVTWALKAAMVRTLNCSNPCQRKPLGQKSGTHVGAWAAKAAMVRIVPCVSTLAKARRT